ncbi:Transcription initiation factor IIF subunit beta [Spraguea lophii 42_110]|uniref:Transcription initiation factor IIF subunit beta n=1 Tax=Spraguea lophii (strain 42_110) TaxID=1358809 RepID=S7XU77_SPRLO|nr:Transcription initiation factor IIF subunit beta [Spraguea lophii 42_110]
MKLDTSKSDVSIWLVKLPPYLSERILNASSDTTELEIGSLEITQSENNQAAVTLDLSNDSRFTDLPQDYEIKFIDTSLPLYVSREELHENPMFENITRIEGKIVKECFVSPVINKKYIAFKKQRQAVSVANNKKEIQVIDYLKEGRKGERFGSATELEVHARRRRIELANKKRERLDKEYIINIMFKAFEKHDEWTVKDLADFGGQPIAAIQEVISEICELNKKDNKNTYTLKAEYKNNLKN